MPGPTQAKPKPEGETKPVAPSDSVPAAEEPKPPREQRAQERKGWQKHLRIAIVQAGAGRSLTRHESNVETCDLSQGGFSFLYPQYVPPGASVEAEILVKGHPVMIVGTVRACYHVDGIRHRVGVRFNQIERDRPKPA